MLVENLSEITDYIIGFLLGVQENSARKLIGYTADKNIFHHYKIVIIPSRFFENEIYGSAKSMPSLPLPLWENTPVLFGEPKMNEINGTIILHADFVASTYFLISRYEEIIKRDERDDHGRFTGKKSLPFRAGFLQQAIVDEYGRILRNYLRKTGIEIKEPTENFKSIYLTHDVDQLAHYRNFRGMAGAVCRILKKPKKSILAIQSYFTGLQYDPWYTFPWLFNLARELKTTRPDINIEIIAFIKTGGGNLQPDKPLHDISNNDFSLLFELGKKNDVKIGLHPSYQAGIQPNLISDEKYILDKTIGMKSIYSRNHFLANREPEDMQALIDAGLTDDFTMGYADVAGFRLGTSRAVLWINPVTRQLTSLTLHPLTIMDTTLSNENYMKLSSDEAFVFCKKIIEQVKTHNGDLVLLWHNTSVEKNNGLYHRELYENVIDYLAIKS